MNKHEAILATHSNVVTIRGDVAYDQNGNIVEYNESTVQAYIDANEYKTLRQYPSIGDQLDMLWHAIDTNSLNKTSDFYTTLKAVKDEYPKSGE